MSHPSVSQTVSSAARESWLRLTSGPTAIMALILLSLAVSQAWHINYGRSAGIDFYQFWLVGGAVGQASFSGAYSLEGRRELTRMGMEIAAQPGASKRLASAVGTRNIFENFSTPFLYSSFRWLNTGRYDRDYLRFQLLCFGALIAAVVFFCRALDYDPAPSFFVLLSVVLGFRPALSDLLVGNVTRLELGGIALALGLSRSSRPWRVAAAGAVLGLVLLFKPNVLFAVLLLFFFWLVDRRWARLAWHAVGLGLGSLAAGAVTWIHWGSLRPWFDWVGAMDRIESESVLASSAGNFGLARALMEMGWPDPSLALTGALTAAAAAAIWLGSRRNGAENQSGARATRTEGRALFEAELLTAAAGLGIPLLGFRLAWMHYFVLALPLMICALRPGAPPLTAGAAGRALRWIVAIAGTLLLFGGPTYLFRSQGPPPPALQYSAGTAILLLLALVDLGRGSAPAADPAPVTAPDSHPAV